MTRQANEIIIQQAIEAFDVVKRSKVSIAAQPNNEESVYIDSIGNIVTAELLSNGINHYNINTADGQFRQEILFQNGFTQDGVNGITNEALMAVLIHRISAQNSSYPSPYNEMAIKGLQLGLACLNARTKTREDFGILNTDKVLPEESNSAELMQSISFIDAIGMLLDATIQYDATVEAIPKNLIAKALNTIAESVDPEAENIDIASAYTYISTAYTGSGIARTSFNISRNVALMQRQVNEKVEQEKSKDGEADTAE